MKSSSKYFNEFSKLKSILVFGAGGHAAEVCEACRMAGVRPIVKAQEIPSSSRLNGTVVRSAEEAAHTACDGFIVAIGDNDIRGAVGDVLTRGGLKRIQAVIHPTAVVSDRSFISDGVYIAAGVIVQPTASIRRDVIINSGAVISHHCVIGDYSHIAPNATLCGGSKTGPRVLVGAAATLLPGVYINSRSVVGAGAVVTRDIYEAIVYGNPARKAIPKEEGHGETTAIRDTVDDPDPSPTEAVSEVREVRGVSKQARRRKRKFFSRSD